MPDAKPADNKSEDKGNRTTLILGIVTAAVTIITALASSPVLLALVNRPAPTAISPTDTPRPGVTRQPTEAAGTPEKNNTAVPVATTAVAVATTSAAPQALLQCLNSSAWQLYPANLNPNQNNGCWQLADWGLTANNGKLSLAFTPSTAQTRGMYVPLTGDADIRFLLRVDQLKIAGRDPAQIVVGVANAASPSPYAGGFLAFSQNKANASSVPMNLIGESQTEQRLSTVDYGTEQEVTLMVRGTQLTVAINNQPVGQAVTIAYNQKAFWVGYVLPASTNAQATLSGLNITAK